MRLMEAVPTSQKRTHCKSNQGGGYNLFWLVFSNIRRYRRGEYMEERLPDRLTAESLYF